MVGVTTEGARIGATGTSAGRMVLDGGRSAALDQAFRTVADTDLGEGAKYGPATIRALAHVITARAYGKPLLELAHLVRIAEVAGGGHGWPAVFFGVRVARPSAFRAAMQSGARGCAAFGAEFLLKDDGVEITYSDGAFRVTYGRMPFLAALMEFLVTALGYRVVDGILRQGLDGRFVNSAASGSANALSRALYDHLKAHLPAAQAVRRFRQLIAFLETTRGVGFGLDSIDDQAVLDYWAGVESDVPSLDDAANEVRTYRAAVEQMARLRTAIEAGAERRAVDGAAPIGSDREHGEIDPDMLVGVLEAHEEAGDPLSALAEPPASRVKFLTGREIVELDPIAALGRQAVALPLSILRLATFGAVQNRLAQAARRRAPMAERAPLITGAEGETYAERREHWRVLTARLDRVAKATLGALLDAGRLEAATEIIDQVPELDLSTLRDSLATAEGANVVALRGDMAAGVLTVLGDRTVVGDRAAGLVAEARAALRAVSRSGFSAEDRVDPDVGEAMATGLPILHRLMARFAEVQAAVGASLPVDQEDARFTADRAVFSRRFERLYGETA